MVEAVTLALIQELAAVPRQEQQGLLRLYVFRVSLFVENSFLGTGFGVVAYQLGMVLVAVQFDDVDVLFVRRPADVGEVAVGRVACLQVYCLAGLYVVYPDGYLMAGHACHRIFVRFQGGDAGRGVHLRIIGHHALVHAVEGQVSAFRTPECTFIDTEFVAVYGLSVYDVMQFLVVFLRADSLAGLSLVGDVQVVAGCIGQVTVGLAEIVVGSSLFRDTEHVGNLFLSEVVAEHVVFADLFVAGLS